MEMGLSRVVEEMKQFMARHLYGEITVKIEAGNIVYCKKTEVLMEKKRTNQ